MQNRSSLSKVNSAIHEPPLAALRAPRLRAPVPRKRQNRRQELRDTPYRLRRERNCEGGVSL